jgi:hypothetical protein
VTAADRAAGWSRRLAALGLAAALALAGCDELADNLQPESVDPKEIVALSRDVAGDVVADGAATVRLSASIPRRTATRTIEFTTTLGTFVETGTRSVKVRALDDPSDDDRAVASTLLRADTTAGTAYVRATISEQYDTLTIRFLPRP